MRLRGVIPPVTTPFDGDRVSTQKLLSNIGQYESRGAGGYLVLGSSGEAALLDEQEKVAVLRATRDAIPAGKPLIAGVGMESTSATIQLAGIAADCGADLVLVLTPHYFGTQMNDAALTAHYRAAADASPVPILLYNVPKFTHVRISPSAVRELAAHGNIAGIKDSSGDLEALSGLAGTLPPEFQLVCGSHRIFVDALSLGIKAGILAAADVFPAEYARMHRLIGEGKREEASALHAELVPASDLVVSTHGVPGIKAAMDCRGFYGGPPRPPLLPVPEAARREIEREIARLTDRGMLAPVSFE